MTRNQRLERLRKQLIEHRDGLRRKLTGDVVGSAGSSQGDEGDAATSHTADELDTRIATHLSVELRQVQVALQKFKEGRYGICEMTGVPIPIARLEALPYTLYSVEAQRLIEEEGYDPEEYRSENGWARAIEHETRLSDRDASIREFEEVDD
jgi:DnaK suppressor protein